MTNGIYRLGIVGAASLLGKELTEVLRDSTLGALPLVLLDGEEATGQITASGDEVTVVQQLEEESFVGLDLVFFTGDPAQTRSSWHAAREAGASIVDMTDALATETEVLVLAPYVEEALASAKVAGGVAPNLGTATVIAAHPIAVMLGLVAARLVGRFSVTGMAATVMLPASDHGRLAMDELHEQTVKLLSFQELPKEQYGAQVAFNVLPSLGEEAKIRQVTRQGVLDHYRQVSAKRLPHLTLQLAHAPVFHGYVASILVDLAAANTVREIEAALAGVHVDARSGDAELASNLGAAGQDDILASVTLDPGQEQGTRFWLWLGADNLRLAALHGIACAVELLRLRPQGTVQ